MGIAKTLILKNNTNNKLLKSWIFIAIISHKYILYFMGC